MKAAWLCALLLAAPSGVSAQCGSYVDILDWNTLTQPLPIPLRIQPCLGLGYNSNSSGPLPTHLSSAFLEIDAAFAAWSGLSANIKFKSGGSNTVLLAVTQNSWAWPADAGQYARTRQSSNAGGIFHFDMVFNMDPLYPARNANLWTTAPTATSGQIHLPTVAVHECGHVVGLADVTTVGCATVMEQYNQTNPTVKPAPLAWDQSAVTALYSNDVCNVGTTWGSIKSMYSGYAAFSGAVALSGVANTIAWEHLANDTTRTYFVYRGEDDSESLILLGTTYGDSLFVDDDTEFGKEYRYHVASTDSTTLLDIGFGWTGLKQVSSTILQDPYPELDSDNALVVHGDNLFVASNDQILRIDVSDPSGPIITGSRTDVGLDPGYLYDLATSPDGSRLYVNTRVGFHVLNATSPELAILGGLPNIVGSAGDGEFISDMIVDNDIVYLACGENGLYAIDVSGTTPAIAGIRDPSPPTLWAKGITKVGSYLYATYTDASPPHRQERLVATKSPAPFWAGHEWNVTFTVDCSTVDGCLDDDLWISREWIGNGALSIGWDAHEDVALNLALPESPLPLRQLTSPISRPGYVLTDPFGNPVDTVSFVPDILSADSDSRYIYATTPMWGDKLDRSLVVFDAWAEGPEAVFATGDTLGSNWGGLVDSQGKYVYLFDMFKARGELQGKSRLRVFEKATGCEADPVAPVRLTPDLDAFKVGDVIAPIWAVGCPISVDVAIVQDGSTVFPVDDQTYSIPDDVAYSTTWDVSPLASDLENHTYQARVVATYGIASQATYFSKPFRIEVGSTLVVDPSLIAPYHTIQEAIDASASGDTILVHAGDYNEHLTLRSNLRIVGMPGARVVPTTTTGGAVVTAIGLVHPPTLDGLEFELGSGINESALLVQDCGVQVRNCTFTGLERAVEIINGYGEFTNCSFVENHDPVLGGAVWINSAATGQTTFTDCVFEGNTAANYAGAVWINSEGAYAETAPQVKFVRCSFKENEALLAAAVRVGQYTRPVFDHCVFASNEVLGASGVVAGGVASAVFTNCTFADNSGAGSYDVVSIDPFPDGPPVEVTSCLFANNLGGNSISSFLGGTYEVVSSDFFGNGTGDASWASSGTDNFSADPAFCGAGNYSIYAFSACVGGVTVPSLVGALDVACVPSAEIEVTTTISPDRLVGCPAGDADSLVVDVTLASGVMTRGLEPDELQIATPYSTHGLWALSPIVADVPAVAPAYHAQVRHRYVSGTAETDSLRILLNNHPLAERAVVKRRGFDLTGDGRVNISDFALFGADYPSPPKTYNARSNFVGVPNEVNLDDFAKFGAHNGHQYAYLEPEFTPMSVAESPAIVSLRFEELDPLNGTHRMKAIVSLEDAGLFRATLVTLKNDNPKYHFIEWHGREGYAQPTMATDLRKDGEDVILIGAMGSKENSASRVELGYFDVEVLSEDALEPKESDFALVSAEVLAMDGAALAVPRTNSQRSYSAPTYANELRQNYPNPFNPTTTIAFSLAQASKTELKIFDVRGALLKTLVNDSRPAGNHRIVWTGDNNQGNRVASGVYFYRLTAGAFKATRKMVLLR